MNCFLENKRLSVMVSTNLTFYAQFDKKAEFHEIVLAFAPSCLLLSNAECILLLFKDPKKTSLRREHSCPGLDPELGT